jgi:hypothetical protein
VRKSLREISEKKERQIRENVREREFSAFESFESLRRGDDIFFHFKWNFLRLSSCRRGKNAKI